MSGSFTLNGIRELKESLRKLPEALTDDGGEIVRRNANEAAAAARAAYPRSGKLRSVTVRGKRKYIVHLQDGVTVETDESGFGSRWGTRYIVKNKAPHAWLYEYGTVARTYYTTRGHRHETGVMPPAPAGRAFVPRMIAARTQMYGELALLLVQNGLEVKGDWRAA